jgi:hypothetical protein
MRFSIACLVVVENCEETSTTRLKPGSGSACGSGRNMSDDLLRYSS